MRKFAQGTIITATVVTAVVVFAVCSFVVARGTVARLASKGSLGTGPHTCAGPSIFSNPGAGMRLCWVFKSEDVEWDNTDYVSLTGEYLGSRGGNCPFTSLVKKWTPVGPARPGYMPADRYHGIAVDHAKSQMTNTLDISRFNLDGAVPMVPDEPRVPKRLRDIVVVEIPLKEESRIQDGIGRHRSETVYVFLTRTGSVAGARTLSYLETVESETPE